MEEYTKKDRNKRILKLFLGLLLMALGVILAYFLFKAGISIPCIFNKITGLQCPGCGNTRAAISILQGDFAAAFKYNALFPLEFFYLVWVFCIASISYIKGKRFNYDPPCQWFDIAVLVIITAWGVIRNVLMFIS